MEQLENQLQQEVGQVPRLRLVEQAPLQPATERITAMGRAIMVLTDDVKTFRSGPSFA